MLSFERDAHRQTQICEQYKERPGDSIRSQEHALLPSLKNERRSLCRTIPSPRSTGPTKESVFKSRRISRLTVKTGYARWCGTHSEWTDDQGRYNLNRMEPGEYLLGANAFNSFGAPDADRPFATAYYPAGENESEAALVKVGRLSPLRLSPLRLRKLEVVTIKINVLWADGTWPERSNIYFKNVL